MNNDKLQDLLSAIIGDTPEQIKEEIKEQIKEEAIVSGKTNLGGLSDSDEFQITLGATLIAAACTRLQSLLGPERVVYSLSLMLGIALNSSPESLQPRVKDTALRIVEEASEKTKLLAKYQKK